MGMVEGAFFKQDQGGYVRRFDGMESVQFPPRRLQGAVREEVCTGVPADVVQGTEMVCDLGDGG